MVKKFRVKKLPERWNNIDKVLNYQSLLYISKIICFELINRYYDDSLVDHFEIIKI